MQNAVQRTRKLVSLAQVWLINKYDRRHVKVLGRLTAENIHMCSPLFRLIGLLQPRPVPYEINL